MWSPDMNSFNHYAYGAISDWIFSTVGGIDTAEDAPAFRHSIIKPCPGGDINWAETKLDTPYGLLAVRWEITGGKLNLAVTVPPNTSAHLVLPKQAGGDERELGSGSYNFSYPWV
jgi:alpha-L-rhamnosidase